MGGETADDQGHLSTNAPVCAVTCAFGISILTSLNRDAVPINVRTFWATSMAEVVETTSRSPFSRIPTTRYGGIWSMWPALVAMFNWGIRKKRRRGVIFRRPPASASGEANMLHQQVERASPTGFSVLENIRRIG